MKTILTVDDSASIRQMVKLALAAGGYAVAEAGDGAAALAALQAGPVDMVVTDLNMPIMDGMTFIREARKLPAGRGIPIIFLTSESDPDMRQRAKAAGATGWITKPFRQDQLLDAVQELVG
ncbi:MAG TPA: response regulator [Acetobacteraceae bacterium]|nr:response regulator [Acetobacteraceae bacterium]